MGRKKGSTIEPKNSEAQAVKEAKAQATKETQEKAVKGVNSKLSEDDFDLNKVVIRSSDKRVVKNPLSADFQLSVLKEKKPNKDNKSSNAVTTTTTTSYGENEVKAETSDSKKVAKDKKDEKPINIGFEITNFKKKEPNQTTLPVPGKPIDELTLSAVITKATEAIVTPILSRLDDIVKKLDKKRKRGSKKSNLNNDAKRLLMQEIRLKFHDQKVMNLVELKAFTKDCLSKTANPKQELKSFDGYIYFVAKQFRDLRGHLRRDFAKNATTYYSVTGRDSWPEPKKDLKNLVSDAINIMHSVYHGKYKLTDNDKECAQLILMEWLEHGGQLDPTYKGFPLNYELPFDVEEESDENDDDNDNEDKDDAEEAEYEVVEPPQKKKKMDDKPTINHNATYAHLSKKSAFKEENDDSEDDSHDDIESEDEE